MIGELFKVSHANFAYNRTKYEKERLKIGDVFLVTEDEGYIVAVRVHDTNAFSFSKNSFELYMLPYLEWFEE